MASVWNDEFDAEVHLDYEGFLLMPQVLSEAEVAVAQVCISDTAPYSVHYTAMENFIRDTMQRKVNRLMQGLKDGLPRRPEYIPFDLQVIKYRVSDFSNSDATTFHRDVVCNREWQPYLTCLTYLDETVMQLIPQSHRQPSLSWRQAFQAFKGRRELTVRPGDILLFYSSLLHRGIFTAPTPTGRRRLVQLFDCVRDIPHLQRLGPLLLHVPSQLQDQSDLMVKISKRKWLIGLLNIIGYMNAARGYGHWLPPSPYPPNVSSEGLQGRLTVVPNTWQRSNEYVLLLPTAGVDLPPHEFTAFKFYSYNRQYIMYGIAALLVLLTFFAALAGLVLGVVVLVKVFAS
jgi:hypothetical protein